MLRAKLLRTQACSTSTVGIGQSDERQAWAGGRGSILRRRGRRLCDQKAIRQQRGATSAQRRRRRRRLASQRDAQVDGARVCCRLEGLKLRKLCRGHRPLHQHLQAVRLQPAVGGGKGSKAATGRARGRLGTRVGWQWVGCGCTVAGANGQGSAGGQNSVSLCWHAKMAAARGKSAAGPFGARAGNAARRPARAA